MLKVLTSTRSLLIIGFISCFLLVRHEILEGERHQNRLEARQLGIFPGGGGDGTGGATTGGTTGGGAAGTGAGATALPTSASATSIPLTTSSPLPSVTAQSSSSSSSTLSSTSSTDSSSSSTLSSTSTPSGTSTPPATSTTPPPLTTSASVSVDANGDATTVLVTVPASTASASPSASQSANADADQAPAKQGVGKGTIIGLSLAGAVGLTVVIAFVVWKFTRKRPHDDFDDNEAIKWPELNAHGGPAGGALPANRGMGFETTSEVNLTRPDSRAGSVAPTMASSVDLYAQTHDPYAVPPLPHMNPSQPYHDEPSTAFYDPYKGPIPQTFNEATHPGEAIPMTQIAPRSRSPGPAAAYDMNAGRVSPGPQAAYGYNNSGRQSPGPAAALAAGRVSPGPQAAYGYGYGGRQSPGPQAAYGGN